MKIAYADPPYIGQAKKHYDSEEVDHVALLQRLRDDYPDGWALSCTSTSLWVLLPQCPENVRIGAWVKPFAIYKPNVNPAFAWEPVIFTGGRRGDRTRKTVRDWVSQNITLKKGLVGVKPDGFSYWLFDLMGLELGDELDDLYPGSGAVIRAWEEYQKTRGKESLK